MSLLEQFKMIEFPVFEINFKDYNGELDDDWQIFDIQADEHGVWSNGFNQIEWDDFHSLDEHLNSLYETIVEESLNGK